MSQRQASRTSVGAGAALKAVHDVVFLHLLYIALVDVHVHVHRLKLHRAVGDAVAAADAGGRLALPVHVRAEKEEAACALDAARRGICHADAHHGSAHADALDPRHVRAGLREDVLQRGAEAAQEVLRLRHAVARDGDHALYGGDALIAGPVDGVGRICRDDVAADAGGQAAGLDLAVGVRLHLHLLRALGVLHELGDDLDAVFGRVKAVQQVYGVLLVLLDAVIALVETVRNADELYALQKLLRVLQHGAVVAAEIGLALGAVYDDRVHLAARALDLEGRREHRAAHADDAGLADAGDDSVGVLELLLAEGLHVLAGRVLKVVLNNDGHDHVAQHVAPGLDGYDLTGDGRVYRGGHRRVVRAYELAHLHRIPHLDDGLVRGAYLLDHRQHHDRRRRDGTHRRLTGGLRVIGVNTAIVLKGHEHHLS